MRSRQTPHKFRVGISADFKAEAAGLLEPILVEQIDQASKLNFNV
jgi:hypothetical protein